MTSAAPLLVLSLLIPLIVVLGRTAKARHRRAADIRPMLDPYSSAWLQSRIQRTSAQGPVHRDNRVDWTARLECPPSGAHRATLAFDGCSHDATVGIVGVDAPCGPAEFVAMPEVPTAVLQRLEPGLVPLEAADCPPGWSLAMAPASAGEVPDQLAVDALVDLGTASAAPWTVDVRASAAARMARLRTGTLRIHFTPHRFFVIGGANANRCDLVGVADHIATHLATRPSGPWADTPRPRRAPLSAALPPLNAPAHPGPRPVAPLPVAARARTSTAP